MTVKAMYKKCGFQSLAVLNLFALIPIYLGPIKVLSVVIATKDSVNGTVGMWGSLVFDLKGIQILLDTFNISLVPLGLVNRNFERI